VDGPVIAILDDFVENLAHVEILERVAHEQATARLGGFQKALEETGAAAVSVNDLLRAGNQRRSGGAILGDLITPVSPLCCRKRLL
jgi:hypothetical protein